MQSLSHICSTKTNCIFVYVNNPMYFDPLKAPLSYSKSGVYQSINYVSHFVIHVKHIVWLVLEAVLMCSRNLWYKQKCEKCQILYEPRREKTGFLHMRKQRR